MSIIRYVENVFYVFDSHSRDENGLPASDGKTTLTLQSLENFKPSLTEIADCLHTGRQHELTSLTLTKEKPDNDDSVASGPLTCNESNGGVSEEDIPLSSLLSMGKQIQQVRSSKEMAQSKIKKMLTDSAANHIFGHISDSDPSDNEEYQPQMSNKNTTGCHNVHRKFSSTPRAPSMQTWFQLVLEIC